MANSRIWRDDGGLFVRTNGQVYRPGSVNGVGHSLRMDDGGLPDGGKVTAAAVEGTELARLKLPDGTITHWHVDGPTRTRGLTAAPVDAVWKANGRRDFRAGVMIGGPK